MVESKRQTGGDGRGVLVEAAPAADMVWVVAPQGDDAAALLAEYEGWIGRNVALRKRQPSPETVRGYLGEGRQFLAWLSRSEPATPLREVTAEVAREYVAWLTGGGHGQAQSGSRRPRDWQSGQYTPATIQRKLAGLKSFFKFARGRGYVTGNPLADGEGIRTPEANEHKTEQIKALTQEQAVTLLKSINSAAARATSPDKQNAALRDKAMISLMMLQGLRVIEVQRLNMADYTPNVWGDQGTLKLHGKGDKHRTVVLRPEMQQVLDTWLNRRELYRPEDDALFVSLHPAQSETSGMRLQRMSRRAIRARVDRYLDQAGLKETGISCHALRHTYATEIVAAARRGGQEVDREGLARSMGHSDISIAEIYIDYVDMFAKNPSAPLMEILREADEG
jgi:site-specific recombinase XerD